MCPTMQCSGMTLQAGSKQIPPGRAEMKMLQCNHILCCCFQPALAMGSSIGVEWSHSEVWVATRVLRGVIDVNTFRLFCQSMVGKD